MPSRHRSRQRALQVLYQWDIRKQPVRDALDSFYDSLYTSEDETSDSVSPPRDPFMEKLVRDCVDRTGEIDHKITENSAHWRLERMPVVDRNILRLAVCEMMQMETPAPVVIDEALELARRFSGEESVPFINGVLDAVRKQLGTSPDKNA
jgi:N utilization substance protein B